MIQIIPTDSNGSNIHVLAQWDRGVTICLSHVLITGAHPVHFQNSKTPEAIVMDSTYEDGVLSVEVPDVLLERTYPITGFVFISDSDESGRSLLTFEIQVRARQRPSDTVYENTQEYKSVSSLITQLTEAVETAQTAAESASASADTAAESAENASVSAEASSTSEANASASEAAAAESATAAAMSEANAAASEANASSSESNAAASASAAASSAEAASASEANAAASEAAAEASAEAAAASAVSAATSEANAAESETAAASSAENAASAAETALAEAFEAGTFNGKSAYEYAVIGGYTGTEDEFAELMAYVITLLDVEEVEF